MSGMEDGFLAAELAAVWLIMLATGWNKEAAGGLKLWPALAAAALLLALHGLELQLPGGIEASGSAVGLLAVACAAMLRLVPRRDVGYTAGCAMLLGLMMTWMNSMYASSPLLVVFREGWDIPLLCGALAALLSLRAANQLVILAAGFWVASIFPAWLPGYGGNGIQIGGPGWWDGFAAAAAACRVLTFAVGTAASSFSRLFVERFNNREGDL